MNKPTISSTAWRKSSRSSDPQKAVCVEVAAVNYQPALSTEGQFAAPAV